MREEMGEEGTKGTKGRGCTRGGLGEGGTRGREKAACAADEPRPKSQGKIPRGAVQVLLTAWTRS